MIEKIATSTLTVKDGIGTIHVIFAPTESAARMTYETIPDERKCTYRETNVKTMETAPVVVFFVVPNSTTFETTMALLTLYDAKVSYEDIYRASRFIF